MKLEQDQIDRFWSKVDIKSEDECWPWLAGIKGKYNCGNYGGFYIRQLKNTMGSHKVSFIIYHNFDLTDDLPDWVIIRHTCNNPICVNPKHLKLGDCQSNSDDRVLAGNSLKGPESPRSYLSWDKINKIREIWSTDEYTMNQIGDMFNCSGTMVRNIVRNKTYVDENYTPPNLKSKSFKYSEEDVEGVRQMKKDGATFKDISNKYNISQSQMYNIINNRQRKGKEK